MDGKFYRSPVSQVEGIIDELEMLAERLEIEALQKSEPDAIPQPNPILENWGAKIRTQEHRIDSLFERLGALEEFARQRHDPFGGARLQRESLLPGATFAMGVVPEPKKAPAKRRK